jgi:hypothetical protein
MGSPGVGPRAARTGSAPSRSRNQPLLDKTAPAALLARRTPGHAPAARMHQGGSCGTLAIPHTAIFRAHHLSSPQAPRQRRLLMAYAIGCASILWPRRKEIETRRKRSDLLRAPAIYCSFEPQHQYLRFLRMHDYCRWTEAAEHRGDLCQHVHQVISAKVILVSQPGPAMILAGRHGTQECWRSEMGLRES